MPIRTALAATVALAAVASSVTTVRAQIPPAEPPERIRLVPTGNDVPILDRLRCEYPPVEFAFQNPSITYEQRPDSVFELRLALFDVQAQQPLVGVPLHALPELRRPDRLAMPRTPNARQSVVTVSGETGHAVLHLEPGREHWLLTDYIGYHATWIRVSAEAGRTGSLRIPLLPIALCDAMRVRSGPAARLGDVRAAR